MIRNLKRNELDIVQYDHCIAHAVNSRIYAFSWYLDIICDDWEALVLDNYKVVMPLPTRKKFGISYIYIPPWSQQLGIFSKDRISTPLIAQFISGIPKKYKMFDIFFNSGNQFHHNKIRLRNNFILSLKTSYKNIRSKYTKGRISSVKKAKKENLVVHDLNNVGEIITLFKNNKGAELKKEESDYLILNKLIKKAMSLNFAFSLGVFNEKNDLIGGAFFLIDPHRITYLFSAINPEGRAKQSMSFLLDYVINKYSEKDLILDFEGSIIDELASFFKSFGAQSEIYYQLKKYRF